MNEKKFFDMSPQQSLVMGLSWGVAVISTIGFLFLLVAGQPSTTKIAAVPTPSAAAPTQQQPSAPAGDFSKVGPVTTGDHIRGKSNAKITLIEYSDFQCPYCSRVLPTIDQILKDYDGQVRLVYRNFPLSSIHPNAQKAAEAAECAADQNKFWEMHDLLFANQQALQIDNLKAYAKQLGLNTTTFNNCLDTSKHADKIAKSSAEAQAAGISGTPGIFVGSQLVAGAYPYDYFKNIIDGLLK